jgi:copper chaperone CopZ
VWRSYVVEVKNFVEELDGFLALLIQKKVKVSPKLIQNKLSKLKEIVNIKNVTESSFKLSEIEEIKEETRKDFYKAIEPILTEVEVKLLQLIIKITKTEGRLWLSKDELYQKTQKELKIKTKEFDQIVEKLIEEGFLKPGISLTF